MADDTQADILEEHRRITGLLARLETATNEPMVRPGWSQELAGMLGELIALLKEHFSGEAETKFFQELMETEPRLSNLITKLAMEHSGIVKAFSEAGEMAQRLDVADESEVSKVKRKVQLAVATLERHEAEENELIMRAYWEDIGAAD